MPLRDRPMTTTALMLAASLAVPAMADSPRLSPADRALKKVLVGAVTSCEAPLVIAGTGPTLGGATRTCAQSDIETLTLRGKPVHVKLVADEALGAQGPLACTQLYKYQPPGAVTQYNVVGTGAYSFPTAKVCITGASIHLPKPNPNSIVKSRGSTYTRTAPPRL